MTKGEVPVREMGSVGKEVGRLEAVLDLQAKVEGKAAEIQDLEEVGTRLLFFGCLGSVCGGGEETANQRQQSRGNQSSKRVDR